MRAAILAGAVYFGCVFAAGVALGVIRVLYVIPAIGEVLAVCAEVPFILGWSWIVLGWIIRGFRVPSSAATRLAMSGTAFALLMIVEQGWPILAGRPVTAQLTMYREAPGLVGLIGQILFALLPLLR